MGVNEAPAPHTYALSVNHSTNKAPQQCTGAHEALSGQHSSFCLADPLPPSGVGQSLPKHAFLELGFTTWMRIITQRLQPAHPRTVEPDPPVIRAGNYTTSSTKDHMSLTQSNWRSPGAGKRWQRHISELDLRSFSNCRLQGGQTSQS